MATAVFGDCDHDIKDVAIKAGEVPSSATLEDNKTATIDVSAYTEPVEVEPSDDYDGMKKTTITLSNIPSSDGTTFLYAWKNSDIVVYTSTETPTTADSVFMFSENTYLSESISAVGEGTITLDSIVYSRSISDDVDLFPR